MIKVHCVLGSQVPFSENDSVTTRTQVSKVIMRRSCPKSKVGTAGRSGVSAVRPVIVDERRQAGRQSPRDCSSGSVEFVGAKTCCEGGCT